MAKVVPHPFTELIEGTIILTLASLICEEYIKTEDENLLKEKEFILGLLKNGRDKVFKSGYAPKERVLKKVIEIRDETDDFEESEKKYWMDFYVKLLSKGD